MNESGASDNAANNATGAQQQSASIAQSPLASASQPEEPTGKAPHTASRARLIVPTVIILIVLVGVAYYALQYFAPASNHITTTIPIVNKTTTINTTTSTIAAPFDGYNLILRQYALYGIPNSSGFEEFYSYNASPLGVPAEPFTRGAVGGALSEFGLPLMAAIINGTVELPWNYNQTMPLQYANYSAPVGAIIQVFNFTNATNAARFLLYDQYYNKTVNGALNGPIARTNNTQQVYMMPLTEASFLTNTSGYSNASALYKTTLVHNFTSISGTSVIMVQITPLYQRLDQYLIGFQLGTYVVYVTGYGIYGHLNMSYPLNTVKYMLQEARS